MTSLKLLFIGATNVGKSSLMLRFTTDSFVETDKPIATIESKQYRLTDTAGQERFRTLTSSYYRGAHGVLLVYDVTQRETFEQIHDWFRELSIYTANRKLVKIVIGNKIDKEEERRVSAEEGRELASSYDALFCETSAKTRLGVHPAMTQLIQTVNSPCLIQIATEKIASSTPNNDNKRITNLAEDSNQGCAC